ncbi:helix-turn-helix transcriptional regulator [Corynebacterium felinum]|uniref:Transcriptional regulator with XRE-family HTH domain n=1 Tax=Corynebacterium felinum TaxID=131318 RepID=A0ABU2B7S1_9CORY|nr:helix-turn-helix transcriptional regulator [Corynebacterium felinum]MDF5821468.1 helix-turn-helix transcriptional regulator [Corynebacterium felinum]MDR7354663.1 transcriptional regulator with XRE-family HTH domain [Corynebacterium felinum]WJY94027.1 Helix-turn-helix protein [Corynebacterium felinum]
MKNLSYTIHNACRASKISPRELAERTGISQAIVEGILNGTRTIKMPEIILIAEATGCTVAQLTGNSVANRVHCVSQSPNDSCMQEIKQQLIYFLELDAYLDDQAIPET